MGRKGGDRGGAGRWMEGEEEENETERMNDGWIETFGRQRHQTAFHNENYIGPVFGNHP